MTHCLARLAFHIYMRPSAGAALLRSPHVRLSSSWLSGYAWPNICSLTIGREGHGPKLSDRVDRGDMEPDDRV